MADYRRTNNTNDASAKVFAAAVQAFSDKVDAISTVQLDEIKTSVFDINVGIRDIYQFMVD